MNQIHKSIWLLYFAFTCCFTFSLRAQQVELKGRLKGFEKVAVLEDFSDLQRMKAQNETVSIPVGEDGEFEVELTVLEPNYYRLGRNILYLSPGDKMKIYIDFDSPLAATFEGIGAVYNTYLKGTSFPKGGSYLQAGRNMDRDPILTYNNIVEIGKKRRSELLGIKGLSAAFVSLEQARIRAEIINSILSQPDYVAVKFFKEGKEFAEKYTSSFQEAAGSMLDSLRKDFINPDFLAVEVYRSIVDSLNLEQAASVEEKQYIIDYLAAERLAYGKIKRESDKAKLVLLTKEINTSIQTMRYRRALHQLLAEKLKFGNGDSAIDFVAQDLSGNSVALSSLKGKVIYIDLWATWCGPCLAQMPELEALKLKYKDNPDLAIVSLSVDSDIEAWKKNVESRQAKGIQWRINRADLNDYEVNTIPRYILIEKDFRIHALNAGSANNDALLKSIETLLGK